MIEYPLKKYYEKTNTNSLFQSTFSKPDIKVFQGKQNRGMAEVWVVGGELKRIQNGLNVTHFTKIKKIVISNLF